MTSSMESVDDAAVSEPAETNLAETKPDGADTAPTTEGRHRSAPDKGKKENELAWLQRVVCSFSVFCFTFIRRI